MSTDDTRKNIEALAKEVFGQRAKFYTTSGSHSDSKALSDLVVAVNPQSDWLALDVATGTGHTALAFAPHVQRVVGLDLTPEMLREARMLTMARGIDNVTFELGDAHNLPFPDNSFDLVTCRRAAHHFTNIMKALAEMRRVLKPQGLLLIEDRSIPEDDFADACMNRLDTLHDPSHVRQYRHSEWMSMLEAAGYDTVHTKQHTVNRPLTSLTDGVATKDADEIKALVSSLDELQQDIMGVRLEEGALFTHHWFITLIASKKAISRVQYPA